MERRCNTNVFTDSLRAIEDSTHFWIRSLGNSCLVGAFGVRVLAGTLLGVPDSKAGAGCFLAYSIRDGRDMPCPGRRVLSLVAVTPGCPGP